MEATAARGGGSVPMPSSQLQRKEWRAVSEGCFRSSGGEVPEHVKLGQSDERTIYEERAGQPLDADFCSITIDGGGTTDDILQQRLHSLARQREEFQQMEIDLRAQVIARSEIMEMQKNCDGQIKEHANANAKLKEQLHERDQRIHGLDMKIEEKERELRAVKIDNEAAWAKEDLLREQNKELATFRLEHENLEAERAQHIKQIHELRECIQQKESQYLELEEQHRVVQETILFKDEQLREAQAWMARAQEMDAFHSTTNQTLQTELRERTDQFNQYLLGLQQQFVEVDKHHRQAIQQLQLELAEAREQKGRHDDDSQVHPTSSKDSVNIQNKGNQYAADGSTPTDTSTLVTNTDNSASFASAPTASKQAEHMPGVHIVPSSILGLGTFLPPGQVIAPHPFVMHPQGTQSVAPSNSHAPQNQIGYFPSVAAVSSQQHWQSHQAVSDIHQISNQNLHTSHVEKNLLSSDDDLNCEISVDQQVVGPDYLEPPNSHKRGSELAQTVSDGKMQVSQGMTHEDSHFPSVVQLDVTEKSINSKVADEGAKSMTNHLQEQLATSEAKLVSNMASTVKNHPVNSVDMQESKPNDATLNKSSVSTVHVQIVSSLTSRKLPEPALLDERALLACLVRVIPSGSAGGIRISSTLPNRLGKMLAPLHWHDYRKQYGKLDEFVSRHPELFVIEGDFIHLREGAQGIISATTAVAKVAAATAAFSPYSSTLPSIAVTPVAQSHRLRRDLSAELKAGKGGVLENVELTNHVASSNKVSLGLHDQQQNGAPNVTSDVSDSKISKSRPTRDLNGSSPEARPQKSFHLTSQDFNMDRVVLSSSQSKGSANGRHVGSKQQGRFSGVGQISKK